MAEIRHTAKLYRFPVRGRAAPEDHRADGKPAVDRSAPPMPAVDCGAWYHQAAVQEAERARKP